MSDILCLFEEEIRSVQQVRISSVGFYVAGLARANAGESIKIGTILNFIEKIERDLGNLSCSIQIQMCIMHRISLGKLGEAKKILNLMIQNNLIEVERFIESLNAKDRGCDSVDSPKIPQERSQIVPPPQIPIHSPVQTSPPVQHKHIPITQIRPDIPCNSQPIQQYTQYNPQLIQQHAQYNIQQTHPPIQYNPQSIQPPNQNSTQSIQPPIQNSPQSIQPPIQNSPQPIQPPIQNNPPIEPSIPQNLQYNQPQFVNPLAFETLELIKQLRQEMQKSKQDPNILALKQQEDMYRKRLEEERASEELAKKLQEEFKNEFSGSSIASLKCALCFDNASQDLITLKHCGHVFHIYCLRNHLQVLIDNQVSNWNCPALNCEKSISSPDIVTVCTPPMRNQIDALKIGASLTPCLTSSCSFTFRKDPNMLSYSCPQCNSSYCLLCSNKLYPGQQCNRYDCCSIRATSVSQQLYVSSRCPMCTQTVFKYKNGKFLWCDCNYVFCPKCKNNEFKCHCPNY